MGPRIEIVRASGGSATACWRVRPAPVLRGLWLAGLLATLLAVLPQPARAGPAVSAQLAGTWGSVWLLERDRAAWVEAGPGQPLAVGDRLATAPGARAVVHAEGVALRIDGGSELERIAPAPALRVQLLAGRLALQVDAVAAHSAQVLTTQGRVLPLAAGHYRVDRIADSTVVESLSGRADFESARDRRWVHAGQRLAFWRDHAGHLRADVVTMTPDDFGRWLLAVPPSVPRPWTAARPAWERERERIEIHRGWVPPPWPAKPRVSPKDGRWVWTSPWGWVWVPDRGRAWGPPPLHDRRWDDRRWDDRRWDDRRWDDRRWDDRRWDDRRWDDRWRRAPGLRDPSWHVPTPRPPPRERARRHPPDDGQPRFGRSEGLPHPAPDERRRDGPPRPPGFSH
jgi:hypothetical protein